MKGCNHVSFECAKLLKAAGYPVIDDFYTEDGVWFPREMLVSADDEDCFFPAAQLWDVQKWLRDQIGIQAVVLPVYDEGNWRYLYRLVSKRGGSELLGYSNSFEVALNDCIMEALKEHGKE